MGKAEQKLSLFVDDMILHVKNTTKLPNTYRIMSSRRSQDTTSI